MHRSISLFTVNLALSLLFLFVLFVLFVHHWQSFWLVSLLDRIKRDTLTLRYWHYHTTIEVGRYCAVKVDLGTHSRRRRTFGGRRLVVNLVVDLMLGLSAASAQEVLDILEGLDGHNQDGVDGSLAGKKEAGAILAADVLVLSCVDIQHVVLSFKSFVVGEEDKTLGVRV